MLLHKLPIRDEDITAAGDSDICRLTQAFLVVVRLGWLKLLTQNEDRLDTVGRELENL